LGLQAEARRRQNKARPGRKRQFVGQAI
jgi:hypothetical protein